MVLSTLLLAAEEVAEKAPKNPILPVANELFWGSDLLLRALGPHEVRAAQAHRLDDGGERAAKVRDDLEQAERAESELVSAIEQYQAGLASAKAEATGIIEASHAEADAYRADVLARAEAQVGGPAHGGGRRGQPRAKATAMAELRSGVADIAVQAAIGRGAEAAGRPGRDAGHRGLRQPGRLAELICRPALRRQTCSNSSLAGSRGARQLPPVQRPQRGHLGIDRVLHHPRAAHLEGRSGREGGHDRSHRAPLDRARRLGRGQGRGPDQARRRAASHRRRRQRAPAHPRRGPQTAVSLKTSSRPRPTRTPPSSSLVRPADVEAAKSQALADLQARCGQPGPRRRRGRRQPQPRRRHPERAHRDYITQVGAAAMSEQRDGSAGRGVPQRHRRRRPRHEVQDELFRFARILEGYDELRDASPTPHPGRPPPADRRGPARRQGHARHHGLVSMVVGVGRARELPAIIDRLVELRRPSARASAVAEVRSAVELTDDQKARLAAALEARHRQGRRRQGRRRPDRARRHRHPDRRHRHRRLRAPSSRPTP